jgi:isoleucyl-tRNA synthetase
MVKVVKGPYNPILVEKEISTWWMENNIPRKIMMLRSSQPCFSFLEGPPTTNGFMHVGHARGRAMKDVVLRLKTMQGFDVWRKAGWDCQGLPVELEVEKKLGVTSKKDIEERIGLEKFVEMCKDLVDFYIEHWRNASERLGLLLDFDNAYETRTDEYIEFVWWAIKKAEEKGLLVEDFKVVPTCPRCETPLSGHEVALGYTTVTDPSIYVKFPMSGKKNEYILIWTTTPWTLPGNEAVCVHPDYKYARVRVGDEVWILAEQLIEPVMRAMGITSYEVIEILLGKSLEGLKYEHPLLDELPKHGGHTGRYDHAVICGEHVTLEEGTGCVHTAPAHGPEDFEIGKKYGLPVFCPVDQRCRFTDDAGKYAGKFVKDADQEIISDLQKKNLLAKSGTIEHEYPLCWRCDSPLVYRTDKQWFIRIAPIKQLILDENKKVDWVPEWAGSSRFYDWLINAEDWCLSRSRIWGSPLNVWVCSACGEREVIASKNELKAKAKSLPEHLELHRPWIDLVILKCSKCGGDMRRVNFVIDCWFDSGVAHAASVNYLKDKTIFNKVYPYDFITEAVDQTRGWFYSLIFTSVMLFGQSPYKRVLCQGHILDKYGQKMSKSRGNVIWSMDAFDKVGADPLRLYMLGKSAPWESLNFDLDEVEQITKSLAVLWNVFVFATTYMDLDGFDPKVWTLEKIKDYLRPEDRWLLSKTQSLIDDVTRSLENLLLHQAVRSLITFITEDLSHLYVRLVRHRVWIEKEHPDKLAAYVTLYVTLETVLRLMAPLAPYSAEKLYQHLVRGSSPDAPESVHMCNWPKPNLELMDKSLELQMEIVRGLTSAVAYARQKKQVKLRWPVRHVYVVTADNTTYTALNTFRTVFLDQINSKELSLIPLGAEPEFVKKIVEPNYARLGPRLKDKTAEVVKKLKSIDSQTIKEQLVQTGFYLLKLDDGTELKLAPDDLLFKEELPPHISTASSKYGVIYLDTTRTPELLAEAISREVVRRAQLMRKEMDLKIEEYVNLVIKPQEKETVNLLRKMQDYILSEVRVKKLVILEPGEPFSPSPGMYFKDWDIEGESVMISLERCT